MKKILTIMIGVLLISSISVSRFRIPNVNKIREEAKNSVDSGSGRTRRTSDAYIIEGASNNKKVTLNGERVEIRGASNTLTITGKVSSITIQGASNTVYVDSVESVSISGASSKVLYKTSPTKSGKPNTSIRGAGSYVGKQ